MDLQTKIFVFYLAIITIPSIIVYVMSNQENKMVYSLVTALAGVIISTILWFSYGKQMVSSGQYPNPINKLF